MLSKKFPIGLILLEIGINTCLRSQDISSPTLYFDHQPNINNRELIFTYTGSLSNFKDTKIYLIYFHNKKLYVKDAANMSYDKQEIKGHIHIPNDVSAFALSISNMKVGHDNNNDKGYIYCLYKNNKPMKGSLYFKSLLLTSGYLGWIPSKNDYKIALQLQSEEFSKYPQLKDKYILTHLNTLIMADSNNYRYIENILDRLLADSLRSSVSEESLRKIENLYAQMHKEEAQDSVLRIILYRYPHGITAAFNKLNKINKIHDKDSLISSIYNFYKEFSNVDATNSHLRGYLSNIYQKVAYQYFLEKKYSKFLYYLKLIPATDMEVTEIVRFYNRLIFQKDTITTSFLKELATAALDAIKLERDQKPVNMSQSDWNNRINMYYPSCIDIYAKLLFMEGNIKSAIRMEKNILSFNSGYTGNFNLHYLNYIMKTGNNGLLLKEVKNIYINNKPCPGIDSILKMTYFMKHGHDENGYNAFKDQLDSLSEYNLVENLKDEMLNLRAPLFTLRDLKGNTVALDQYRGKIVVLDFWATWCMPCIQAFVGMNKIKNKYSGNKDVAFLFIDEDESTPDNQSRKNKIRGLLKKKHYRFKVLLDSSGQNNVLHKKYNINVIPAKVIIDKNGLIQFKEKGYSGDPLRLAKRMGAMINILQQD